MYPKWYTREMDQLEEDYDQGLISNEEFNKQVKSIDRVLDEEDRAKGVYDDC